MPRMLSTVFAAGIIHQRGLTQDGFKLVNFHDESDLLREAVIGHILSLCECDAAYYDTSLQPYVTIVGRWGLSECRPLEGRRASHTADTIRRSAHYAVGAA